MSRIFASLAIVSVLLLSVTLALGLNVGKYNELYREFVTAMTERSVSPVKLGAVTSSDRSRSLSPAVAEMRQRLKLHQERAVTHKLTAIVAALVCVLVHCISVTYFIGTNRWCKEVAAAYRLDPDCVRRSNRLKARSFPWSFAGVLSVLAIIALGAACDPTTQRQTTWQWVQPHFWGALAGTAFIVASFLNQWMNIQAHSELVDAVLREVQRIRLEHGLEVATSVR